MGGGYERERKKPDRKKLMEKYANVIIDISHEKVDKTFQYRIPERLAGKLTAGCGVRVPFGRGDHLRSAYVIELTDEAEFDVEKLKEIAEVEEKAVPVEVQLITLAAWMKRNYGGTMSAALKTVIPVKRRVTRKEKEELCLAAEPEMAGIHLAEFERKHHYAKARLLAELMERKRIPKEIVTGKLHIAAATIRSLESAGLLFVERKAPDYRKPFSIAEKKERRVILTEEQEKAVDAVLTDYRRGIRGTYLLHGITGSGKTEVYLALIEEVVRSGKQVIVLIPEIALTYQTVMRFYGRFGDRVSILNSRMSSGERYDQYLRAKEGDIDIMIGPRSALFTPFASLGLIIIDEEHETSYKSEREPRYHARETAVERGRETGASVVLGSATPSVESYCRAEKGEYRLLTLTRRPAEARLPSCEIIDLREELRSGNRSILSRRLSEAIEQRLLKSEQTMLFLNRRGISGFVSCRSCGEVLKCPHCDVSLSLHRGGRLICHYCGYETAMPTRCPGCGSKYIGGMRAGTEKIEELVSKAFPGARVLRMDADTTKEKNGYEKILAAFSNREADILIGTQMIVKGHDFPNVTLVGVLAADLSLNAGDFHAAERTFDLIAQAVGRAGRGEKAGEALIQTYRPEHYAITNAAAQDYIGFYREEMAGRRLLSYPPASHMLSILSASEKEEDAREGAESIARLIRILFPEAVLFGPADAPIAKVRDVYKKVLYLKDENYGMLVKVKDAVEGETRDNPLYRRLFVQFDFDPEYGF